MSYLEASLGGFCAGIGFSYVVYLIITYLSERKEK